MARWHIGVALLLLLPSSAVADQAAGADACKQAAGSFLAGKVDSDLSFHSGAPVHGVHLSHTHLTLLGDDGTRYDVVFDNVFANGYRRNQASVPAPLNAIRVGDRLELCGELYTGGAVGIHWVHTNCGATPTADKPNGWVRKVDQGGNVGENMEANQAFCSLWPN